MGRVLMTGGGGSVGISDECTATVNDIPKGRTAVFNGSDDEAMEGTLELTGTATAEYVYEGRTFYNTDLHTKLTGKFRAGSILNFSAAAYSGRQVLLKWQNPYAAAGRPFSGVIISYSTNGPDGPWTWLHTGYGDNKNSGGWSQAIFAMPNLNTKYYFKCTAYATSTLGDLQGNTLTDECATSEPLTKIIKYSQDIEIPSGYNFADLFCVGGGGSGGWGEEDDRTSTYGAGGGGGGYTSTVKGIAVKVGAVLNCIVGNGGVAGSGTNGGESYVARNGEKLCSANGGAYGHSSRANFGTGKGGSGGGSYSYDDNGGYNGGTNGGDGGGNPGSGQGRTTKAFGEDTGTAYSGGGASGGEGTGGRTPRYGGTGGDYGGGNGGRGCYRIGGSESEGYDYAYAEAGRDAAANSGSGGGGGGGGYDYTGGAGGAGGSGIIIVILY